MKIETAVKEHCRKWHGQQSYYSYHNCSAVPISITVGELVWEFDSCKLKSFLVLGLFLVLEPAGDWRTEGDKLTLPWAHCTVGNCRREQKIVEIYVW